MGFLLQCGRGVLVLLLLLWNPVGYLPRGASFLLRLVHYKAGSGLLRLLEPLCSTISDFSTHRSHLRTDIEVFFSWIGFLMSSGGKLTQWEYFYKLCLFYGVVEP